MINVLIIFIYIKLNLDYQIIRKKRSVLYALKKDISYLNNLKKSMTSQKINSKSNFIKNLIKKLFNILPILKK